MIPLRLMRPGLLSRACSNLFETTVKIIQTQEMTKHIFFLLTVCFSSAALSAQHQCTELRKAIIVEDPKDHLHKMYFCEQAGGQGRGLTRQEFINVYNATKTRPGAMVIWAAILEVPQEKVLSTLQGLPGGQSFSPNSRDKAALTTFASWYQSFKDAEPKTDRPESLALKCLKNVGAAYSASESGEACLCGAVEMTNPDVQKCTCVKGTVMNCQKWEIQNKSSGTSDESLNTQE